MAFRPLTGLVFAAISLAGCGDRNFGAVRTTTTEADDRVVMASTPQRPPVNGAPVIPNQIFCAEPSPDVAKAVSSASQAAVSAQVNATQPQSGTAIEAAGTVAAGRSRAEALAQLAERLATIQLLRDGLYRACEAFANGAVGPISYALMLSRYGDTMVTLLGSEMAAGAFGRQLSALGTGADGSAQASLAQARQAADQVTATQTRIRELEQQRTQVVEDIAAQTGVAGVAAAAALNQATPEAAGQRAEALEKVRQQEQRKQQIDAELAGLRVRLQSDQAAQAMTAARAQTLVQGGAITGTQRSTNAGDVLLAMQRNYLRDGDLSAMTLACITALQQSTAPVSGTAEMGSFTELARLCGAGGGLLNQLVAGTRAVALGNIEIERLRAERQLVEARRGQPSRPNTP